VSPTATRDDIRIAYRNLARRYHPDAMGDASAIRMAQINEAWRVLSDPARRASYDAMSASPSAPAPPTQSTQPGTYDSSASATVPVYQPPARFPWRFMLVLGSLAVAFILVNAAFTKPALPAVPDNLIEAGSCVSIDDNGDAVEVACNGANDGVVESLIPFGYSCGQGTESHRDRQGMGQVCVLITNSG
jgi:hypothetical protein